MHEVGLRTAVSSPRPLALGELRVDAAAATATASPLTKANCPTDLLGGRRGRGRGRVYSELPYWRSPEIPHPNACGLLFESNFTSPTDILVSELERTTFLETRHL